MAMVWVAARLGDPLLGADDVDDALVARGHVKKRDARFGAVGAQGLDHGIGQLVGKRLLALVGRHDVVHGRKGAFGMGHPEAEIAQHAERLRAGDLMDEVRADQKLRRAV